MGQDVLRKLLLRIKSADPSWYTIIADEATDVSYNEQLNLSIRYEDNNYVVHEDSIGLYPMPATNAATIACVIKDILIRTSLPISLCCGQAYDGAAVMQGKRSGVATRIMEGEPAALPVHCFAHSFNLCLQDAARKIQVIHDCMDIVREIVKLIKYSPKRKTLFLSKLTDSDHDQTSSTIKPLCPTRWTVRTAAIGSVIDQYDVIMETMEEVNKTTRDEYLKTGGVLSALEKYSTLFGLRLGHLLFGAAEETSKALQAKDTSVQEAISSVTLLESFFKLQRTEHAFDVFYTATEALTAKLAIAPPVLPRYRKQPRRLDDGDEPRRFNCPKTFFRHVYYESFDLLIQKLKDRFNQDFLKPVVAMESTIVKAANSENFCSVEIDEIQSSVFGKVLDIPKLK